MSLFAQERPRLVVGIVVDQMRYDYLYRYWDDMGDKGFKRLLHDGHVVHDGHYHYVPTFTAPGHASVYTGTGPAMHGIIGNNWYSREEKKSVYCAGDPSVQTVGSTSNEGEMSPHRLTATTMCDQLELATNRRSKTIGISIKDRGAILPVGFLTDGAYWYDRSSGNFITSTYYRESLPDWVKEFNSLGLPAKSLSQPWTLLLPQDRYEESLPDDRPYEQPYEGMDKAVFPHDFMKIQAARGKDANTIPFDLLPASPYGNSVLAEFAKATIVGEEMGQDDITDFLALSFSSTDYIGHQFGPHSMEVQDVYLRLDRDLEDFFSFLDKNIGMENVLIFLTADHAGGDVPGYISPPAGYFKSKNFENGLRERLTAKFKKDPIEYFINQQIYFSRPLVADMHLLEAEVKAYAASFAGVYSVVSLQSLDRCAIEPGICDKIVKGVSPGRSGDVYLVLFPGWMPDYTEKGGTTHGSPYSYDTHVPIIFYGWGVKPMDNYRRIWIQDIAPTICGLLKISTPSGCTGQPAPEVFGK